MSIDSVLRLPEPPDLLRRFVETPIQFGVRIGDHCIWVCTNHRCFCDAFAKFAADVKESECTQKWTIVCDPELPSKLGEPTLIESGPVAVLSFGRACFLALQRDRMELLGFVSSGLGALEIEGMVLPRVIELTSQPKLSRASNA